MCEGMSMSGADKHGGETGGHTGEDLSALRHVRKMRRAPWLTMLMTVGAFVAAGLVSDYLRLKSDVLVAGVAVVGLAVFFWQTLALVDVPCPRCGNRFFSKGMFGNVWAGHCLHCGVSLQKTRGASNGR